MWDRGQLKEQAKANLRATYLTALAVAFVAAILLGETSINSAGGVRLNFNIWEIRKFFNFDFYNFPRVNFPWFDYSWFDNSWFDFRWNIVLFSILSGLFVLFTGGIIAFAISIFVGAPITVGKSRFFIFNSSQPASFSLLFSAFRNSEYLSIVKTMFFRALYTFLWSLLFIIPGIIKYYEYYMVPYILANNPNMDTNRALALSSAMTNGQKMNIFIMDISFIGWYLLGALLCGIGLIFVAPYPEATKALLYLKLRENAIMTGMCSYEELK